MPPRDVWQYLPSEVLRDQRRAEAAKAWADRQRQSLASEWGAMHLADAEAMFARMPATQEPQNGASMGMGGQGSSFGPSGEPEPMQAPQTQAMLQSPESDPFAGAQAGGSASMGGMDALARAPLGVGRPAETGPMPEPDPSGGLIGRAAAGVAEGIGGLGRGVVSGPAPAVNERLRGSVRSALEPIEAANDTVLEGAGGLAEAALPLPPGAGRRLVESAGQEVIGMYGPPEGAGKAAAKLAGPASAKGAAQDVAESAGGRLVGAAESAVGGAVKGGVAAVRRMFHGSGSAFDSPDAVKFDDNGLFGPAYYLTSDARVAGSYAGARSVSTDTHQRLDDAVEWARQGLEEARTRGESAGLKPAYWEQQLRRAEDATRNVTGPNIRAVDVPEGLNLLTEGKPVEPSVLDDVAAALEARFGRQTADEFRTGAARVAQRQGPPDGTSLWESVHYAISGRAPLPGHGPSKAETNKLLAGLGYDGVSHGGGQIMPMKDDAGNTIEHAVNVIFPDALPKIRNAISGLQGGTASIRGSIEAGGAVAGGATGYATAEPQGPDESDAAYALRVGARTAGGIVTGAVGGMAATREGRSALRTMGQRATEAGVVPGMSVKPVTAGPATAKAAAQEALRLRLDKFPEGVRDTIEAAAKDGDFWRTQRRGVIPDAQAEQMADDLGRTVDQVIARGKAGKAYNTEETRAIRNALVAQSVKVQEMAAEVAASPTLATPRMIAEQVAEGMKLADLSRVAEGARAEAGRTLRAYTAFARDYAANPEDAVQRIFRANGLSPEEATTKVAEFAKMTAQGADPIQMANFWAKVERPPVVASDWFRALRYNSMLSGPRTMLVNIVGNAAEVPWRLGRDVGASALSRDLRPIAPEVQGIGAGALKGILGARQILRHGITQEQALAGDLPRSLASRLDNPVAKGAANALEAPGRVLGATDEFFRQLAYGLQVGRSAGITASKEGLSGKAWAARVDELVDSPAEGMVEGALAVADRMTYKGEMAYLGEKVLLPLQGWSLGPVPVGNIVMPFLRTVYHITARGVDRSPLGLVGTGVDVLRGAYKDGAIPKGAAPLGERAGDALMGTVAFAGLALYAAEGKISGRGPEDVQKRKLMEAEGWMPYSVKVGDEWVSYTNWGPMAVSLSAAAALTEAEGEGPERAYDVFTRGARVLTEQSYLQGIGNIFKVLDQQAGPTYGEKLLEGTLSTVVPYGAAINTLGQATDPLVRQPEKGDVGSALQARFPGARESVPARQDAMGRDVQNPQQGLASAVPLRTSPAKKDSVVRALLDAGVDIPEPPKTVSNGAVRNLPLTTAEQRDYRRITGEKLSAYVEKYLASDKGKADPPERRTATIQAYLDAARKGAEAQILGAMGNDQIERRLKAATPVREAVGAGARP